jgi:orotate phosphoribosyltransferase
MTDSQTRSELQNMIHTQALQFGQFTLASGQTSTYYIDGKEVTLRGRGLYLLASMILDYLDDAVEAVGGMSIGADPITGAVIALAAAQGRSLTGFLVRKQRKERGTTKLVEGPLSPGMKVAMLEDTMTTGGSTLSAIDSLLEEYEVEVVQVLTMVDRLQGGRENLAAAGHTLTSLFEITEFGIAIE